MPVARSGPFYSSCPACGGENLKRRWEVNSYTIARCAGCSLVFVQNILTTGELAAHYATVEDAAYIDSNADCLNYYYYRLREQIESRFPQPGKLLDVGCSAGWFLDVMKGWECHGCEIVPKDADLARRRYADRIVTGSFEDYPLREDYFDVIALQDVFDHFRDPLPALAKCRRMLKPGGLIVIKVHNISCLYAKLCGRRFYALLPPSHLFYYDGKTLPRILTSVGFHVVDSRFIGHLLKVKTVFWRLAQDNKDSVFSRIGRRLDGSFLGDIKIKKNLHDIVTVLAVKPQRRGPGNKNGTVTTAFIPAGLESKTASPRPSF